MAFTAEIPAPASPVSHTNTELSAQASTSGTSDLEAKLPQNVQIQEDVESLPSAPLPRPRAWRTSLIRFGPISGIVALLTAACSILTSLAILLSSDGMDRNKWSAEPSIYLAICTAVANLAIRYACIQGVVIAWYALDSVIARSHSADKSLRWCRALRGYVATKGLIAAMRLTYWLWTPALLWLSSITTGGVGRPFEAL